MALERASCGRLLPAELRDRLAAAADQTHQPCFYFENATGRPLGSGAGVICNLLKERLSTNIEKSVQRYAELKL